MLKVIGALLYLLFVSFCIGETRAEERERKRRLENETVN